MVDALGLRPTPDRVRETVFNWINHQLGGDWDRASVLDLYAEAMDHYREQLARWRARHPGAG